MQKPNKKYSNKIVVDEYEKIVQAHPPLKGPQVIFPSKFDHYQPVNNEEKQQLLLKVNQKHPNLRSRHHETEMPKEQKVNFTLDRIRTKIFMNCSAKMKKNSSKCY